MRSTLSLLVLALLVGACDSTGPAKGQLRFGIVEGNHQVATAGDTRLLNDVVTRMVRDRNGRVSLHIVRPLYAQGTVVQGSPVPGAVVCAEPPDTIPETGQWLRPFVRCTNTDDDGEAVFHFKPGTLAGEIPAEVRGTVEGEPTVFDRVVAYVAPGALHSWELGHLPKLPTEGDAIDYSAIVQGGRDIYQNPIDASTIIALDEPTWEIVIPAINSNDPSRTRPESVYAEGAGWVVVTPPWREHDGPSNNAYWLFFTIGDATGIYSLSVHPTSEP